MQIMEVEINTYVSQSLKTIKPLTNEWLFLLGRVKGHHILNNKY